MGQVRRSVALASVLGALLAGLAGCGDPQGTIVAVYPKRNEMKVLPASGHGSVVMKLVPGCEPGDHYHYVDKNLVCD